MGDFDESKHPRGAHGRFGSLSAWAEKLAGPLANKVEKDGGFSYRSGVTRTERVPTTGIMVSRPVDEKLGHVVEIAKMHERIPPPTVEELRKEVRASVKSWLEKSIPSIPALNKSTGYDHFLGGWAEHDKKTGDLVAMHFDVSQRFTQEERHKALQTGRERNQKAVWHIDEKEEIDTGGTGR